MFGVLHIQQCRVLPTCEHKMGLLHEGQHVFSLNRVIAPTREFFHVFWFTSESAPRLDDYIIIRECSAVIFVSCCVCSCMINPPILSSWAPILGCNNRAEVYLTHVAQMKTSWVLSVLQGPAVLVVESAGAFIPFNLRMIQDNCNRICSLCLVRI